MKLLPRNISLRWRVFAATSITVTLLFAVTGWLLQQYSISVADESVRAEIRASNQAYEAVWSAKTRVLSATSALLASMSDVRAAFLTRDQRTIQDFTREVWSRVPEHAGTFLVLNAEGRIVSSFEGQKTDLRASTIPIRVALLYFPKQLAGYLIQGSELFYIVLTPVYVQTSGEPLLLNVLCAGFRIDDRVASELKQIAPASDFAFLTSKVSFASTLSPQLSWALVHDGPRAGLPGAQHLWQDRFIVFPRTLADITGKPVAELRILRPYDRVRAALTELRRLLGIAWLVTTTLAMLFSFYLTNRLLGPVRLLDKAAISVGKGDFKHRIPVSGSDELSRLAATFNEMCNSIEQARADLIRREQIETIGRLGSSLVHDLRNPLAAIYGGAEMLIDNTLPPEQTRRIATNIYRASQRVQDLLRDLLNLSRGVGGQVERFKLRELVAAAGEAASSLHPEIRVLVDIEEGLQVHADRTRLERVFYNLISNAIEAMPGGGEVSIKADFSNDRIRVMVQDTGPGIPVSVRSQLFQPFVTGKRSGLGLGLTLCRQTMVALGGGLDLLEHPGPGACFCVHFPYDQA